MSTHVCARARTHAFRAVLAFSLILTPTWLVTPLSDGHSITRNMKWRARLGRVTRGRRHRGSEVTSFLDPLTQSESVSLVPSHYWDKHRAITEPKLSNYPEALSRQKLPLFSLPCVFFCFLLVERGHFWLQRTSCSTLHPIIHVCLAWTVNWGSITGVHEDLNLHVQSQVPQREEMELKAVKCWQACRTAHPASISPRDISSPGRQHHLTHLHPPFNLPDRCNTSRNHIPVGDYSFFKDYSFISGEGTDSLGGQEKVYDQQFVPHPQTWINYCLKIKLETSNDFF